jgi:hypothetical protein
VNKCTHTRKVKDEWVLDPYHDPEEYAIGGFDCGPGYWKDGGVESTTVDVDLHRYKCTQCGEIMYYSEYGRKLFEGE